MLQNPPVSQVVGIHPSRTTSGTGRQTLPTHYSSSICRCICIFRSVLGSYNASSFSATEQSIGDAVSKKMVQFV